MISIRENRFVSFGADGAEDGLIGTGWGEPEGDFRWMLGNQSTLRFAELPIIKPIYLVLHVAPLALESSLWPQRLSAFVNGTVVALPLVCESTLLIIRIDPYPKDDGNRSLVVLSHPDWVQLMALFPYSTESPDSRALSLRVREAVLLEIEGVKVEAQERAPKAFAPPDPAAQPFSALALKYFASIGDNCEFGLYQRRHGVEPPDLFRFSRLSVETLMIALQDEFAELCEPSWISFGLRGDPAHREYVMIHEKYKFFSHTHVIEGSMPIARMIGREIKKLFFLRRLILEDLRAASRIFVFKSNVPLSQHEIQDLSDSLQKYGDNVLLYVIQAPAGVVPGTVERRGERILIGYLDEFLDYMRADVPASDIWLSICEASYALWLAVRKSAQPVLARHIMETV